MKCIESGKDQFFPHKVVLRSRRLSGFVIYTDLGSVPRVFYKWFDLNTNDDVEL